MGHSLEVVEGQNDDVGGLPRGERSHQNCFVIHQKDFTFRALARQEGLESPQRVTSVIPQI